MKKVYQQIQAISLLSLLGMVSFFGTLQSPFLYDDAHAIVENPYIGNLWDFQNLVGIENILNRSVVLLTYAVNREVGQLNVFGFHLVNILLHICTGIVLYFLARSLLAIETPETRSRLAPLPMLAATLHLLHPLTVQSVTYLSNRSSLLVTLFYLLGIYFFILTVQSKKTWKGFQKFFYTALVILFFLLGAGSKGIIVTLPVMGMLYLWFKIPKMETHKLVLIGTLILSPVLVYLGYRYAQMGSLLTLKADPGSLSIDRGFYFMTQMKALVFYYLWKLLLPFNLNFEPDVRLVTGILDPLWIAGLGVIVLMSVGIYYQKSRLAMFACIWALVTILPTSSIIPLKQIVTEHRTYLPGIGISIAMGIGILNATRFTVSRLAMIFSILLVFTFLTLNRGLDFRTEIIIWEDTAKKSPNKTLVHNNLAAGYLAEERIDDARRELAITLDLDPDFADAHLNLGFIFARQIKWEQARIAFDRALMFGSNKADGFFNAGLMRVNLNLTDEAIPFFIKAVEMKPYISKYHFELGNAFRSQKRMDEALREYRLTLKTEPGHMEAQNNIGVIFWTMKQYEFAEKAFKKAQTLGADNTEIHNNLASIYMIQQKPEQAIPHLRRLIALQPENAKARQLLKIAMTLQKANSPRP